MKMKLFIILALITIAYGCAETADGTQSAEDLKEIIKQKEDSLMLFQKQGKVIPNEKRYELIRTLLDFQRTYPKDPYAPECLNKVQMSYSLLGVGFKAVQYSDSLIKNYPKYPGRALVIESQASNYDFFNQPRDTAKVRYYYTLLIEENPKMDKEKKEGILMRLKHLDLTLDQYIEFINKK